MPPFVFGFGAGGDRTMMLAVAPFSLASEIVTATSNSTKKTPSAPANVRRTLESLSEPPGKLLALQHDSDGKGNFRLGVFAKHIQTAELGDQLCISSEGITSTKKKQFTKSTAFLRT